MAVTVNYGMTLVEEAQQDKEVTINAALTTLDTYTVTIAPATLTRNVIQGTAAGATPLSLRAHASQSARMFTITDSTATLNWVQVSEAGRFGIGSSVTGAAWLEVSRPAQSAPATRQQFRVVGPADTALTASVEAQDIQFLLNRIQTWATGALTSQRAIDVRAPTLAFAGASTVTNAVTLYIDNAPVAGTNATLTNRYAIWVDAGKCRFDGDGTHVWELPADATDPTGGGGAAAGRIPVLIGGALRYLPYYLMPAAFWLRPWLGYILGSNDGL